MPYYHVEVHSDLTLKPCCKFTDPWLESLTDYDNVDRSEFDDNILSDRCNPCSIKNSYKEVKILEFRRKGLLEPTGPKLQSINLFLDNVCSNSCLMCNANNSTTIGYLLDNQIKTNFKFETLESHLKSLRWVSIYGGEPLQSPNLIKLCNLLQQSEKLEHLNIITSLAKPLKGNLQALKDLHIPVNFRISIDGEQELNSWIRGYKEKDWIDTFNSVKLIGSINWQITLGGYNIFGLTKCLDYVQSLVPNTDILPCIVNTPIECGINQLPDNLKKVIKQDIINYSPNYYTNSILKTALELLDQQPTLDWEQCKKYINRLPSLRKELNNFDYFIKKYMPNM